MPCTCGKRRIGRKFSVVFFKAPATTGLYTLSLHDALPIYGAGALVQRRVAEVLALDEDADVPGDAEVVIAAAAAGVRSEEHTSELQSQSNLVCRLLLEKKNNHTG